VVCTFGLCAIPDPVQAIDEMRRVLRPHGRLLLADHVASTSLAVRALQTSTGGRVHPTGRRTLPPPTTRPGTRGWFEIENSQRFKLGIVERLVACRPGQA